MNMQEQSEDSLTRLVDCEPYFDRSKFRKTYFNKKKAYKLQALPTNDSEFTPEVLDNMNPNIMFTEEVVEYEELENRQIVTNNSKAKKQGARGRKRVTRKRKPRKTTKKTRRKQAKGRNEREDTPPCTQIDTTGLQAKSKVKPWKKV